VGEIQHFIGSNIELVISLWAKSSISLAAIKKATLRHFLWRWYQDVGENQWSFVRAIENQLLLFTEHRAQNPRTAWAKSLSEQLKTSCFKRWHLPLLSNICKTLLIVLSCDCTWKSNWLTVMWLESTVVVNWWLQPGNIQSVYCQYKVNIRPTWPTNS